MKYSLKIILTMFLVMILVTSGSIAAFAEQSFSDVSETYWAYSFIEKVSRMEVMPGYEDATFKPTSEISRLEGIVTIYKLLKASGKIDDFDEDASAMKYYSMIEEAKIPKELKPYGKTYPAVSYALDNKIIEPAELKAFVKEEKLVPAKKIEIIVFIAKALNKFKQEDLKYADKIISFDFEDDTDISSLATNYVYFLIENNVISGKGDESGKLLPKIIVTRQLMAAILCGFNDSLLSSDTSTENDSNDSNDSKDSKDSNEFTDSEGVKTGSYVGTISNVYPLEGLVEVKDVNKKNNIYDLEDSKILMDNKELSSKNLEQGQEVNVTLMNGKVIQINILRDFDKYEGKFLKLSATSNDAIGDYKVLTMEKDDSTYGFFKVRDSLEIDIDGKEATIDDIKANDRIVLIAETDSYDCKKILVVSKFNEQTGILYAPSEFKTGDTVTIKISDGRIIEHKIDSKTSIVKRNGEAIEQGEIVKVISEFGKIIKIEGTGMKSEDVGIIKEILISSSPKVTITRNDGSLKSYSVSEDVEIILDESEDKAAIYDLRLDQRISLKMDSSGVTNISLTSETTTEEETLKINGKITEIFRSTNNFKLEDLDGKIWTVGIKSGSPISMIDYKVDDDIYVFGLKLSEEFIEVERIIK